MTTPGAVIFALVKNNQLLMEQRTFSEEYKDILVFTGGTIEPNETPEETMLREANEELGIGIKEYTKLDGASYKNKNDIYVEVFLITKWEGELPNHVIDQGNKLIWENVDELKKSQFKLTRMIASEISKKLGNVASK